MKLSATERLSRLGLVTLLNAGVVALRMIDPATIPWRSSCGALTGLPCIFCGATRAFHHLLNGRLEEALYFNWLVFPLGLLMAGLFAVVASELILGRRLPLRLPSFRFTPRIAAVSAVAVMALWLFQVSLAFAWHKHELLNPNGVLYRLLVR